MLFNDFICSPQNNFSKRKSAHKKNVNNKTSKKYHCPIYSYIRRLGGWDEFIMEVYEKYPCNTRQEGLQKEQEIINLLKPSLNNMKACKNV